MERAIAVEIAIGLERTGKPAAFIGAIYGLDSEKFAEKSASRG